MIAYLGLGSNLGDRWANLSTGVAGLAELDEGLELSPVYETDPVGGPQDQGPYLNCVARVRTGCGPEALLDRCLSIEQRAGRVRTVRFGPRTLDVDVLLIDDLVVSTPDLVVPHPRMFERAFVLVPLAVLDPDLVGERLTGLDTSGVRPVGELVRSGGDPAPGKRRSRSETP